jgi:hypothetical protein
MTTSPTRRRSERRRRLRHRTRGERGAIAVEAAIAGPLLVLLFFGVLEMGFLLRARTVITDASREGARVAAALPREDGYQNSSLASIVGVIRTQKGEPIDYVTIYKADPMTGLPASGEDVESCLIDCWRFEWIPGAGFQQKLGAQWPAATQRACGGVGDTDWIGVYVRGHHTWVTGILGADRSFTDRTVMRLEPMSSGTQCRP